MKRRPTEADLVLECQLKELGVRGIEIEWAFHDKRMWRFDFAVPHQKLAIEIEGGIWVRGRHTRGKGFLEDCRKYAEATVLGWTVFRFPTEMVLNGESQAILKRWLDTQQ